MSETHIPEVINCCGIAGTSHSNFISQRREVEEKLAGHGWGPSKIGRHLFHYHRHLIPSDTEEQAIDLVRKDLKVIFSEIEDAEDAMRAGRMAEKVLRKRLMDQLELAWSNAQDLNNSEPYRASQAKLARELTLDLAKLDRVSIDEIAKKLPPAGRYTAIVGEGGVVRVEQGGDEDAN